MSTVGGSLTIVQVPVIGSLIILLTVTLVMQLIHREVIVSSGVYTINGNKRSELKRASQKEGYKR